MKQTNDLMHHGLNGQPETITTVAHRTTRHLHQPLKTAILLLALIMGWGSRVLADETYLTINQLNGPNQIGVNADQFSSIVVENNTTLRVYTEDMGLGNINTQWNNIAVLANGNKSIPQGSYYVSDINCYEIPFSDLKSDVLTLFANNNGLFLQVASWGNQSITKVSIYTPGGGSGSSFINSTSPSSKGTGTKEVADNTTHPSWESFSLAELSTNNTGATVFGTLGAIKYARVYVKEGNTSVAYDSHVNGQTADLLSVTVGNGATVAPAAGAGETPDPKNGLNIYNGGTALNLSDITVTLNAGENHLKDYKIIVLLSTSALTNEGNEPTWDFEYTYSFTYPTSTREIVLTDPEPGAIPMTALTEQYYAINIRSNIREAFPDKFTDDTDDGANPFMQLWNGKWYITDASGNKQPLAQGNGANGSWSDGGKSYNGWSLVNNELSCSSTNNTNGWFFNQQVGNLTVYAPSGKTLGDYLGYRVVFEVSDENPSVEPKVRFVLPIPTGVIFEYDGTPTNTAITQTLDSRTDVSTVTLDWTGTKTSPAITSTGYKYARFYVVDQSGTPVSPTDNTHKLTVNGGTACVKATSGYYVYSGGVNDITLPTVTLSCTGGDVRDYSVVCWLATTTDNINATGNDVAEEPDIDVSYTYSFVKPALTKTVDKTGDIAWGSSMQADASDGAPTDWGTTWAELSREQRVVWYVTDGTTKQPLALGTAAQSSTWVLNLPNTFSVNNNEAVLTGQTTFTATEWNTWGKPALFAPTDAAYADVHTYKVVCEVYETEAGTVPNVCYTFSFTKDFLGELKSGVTGNTQVETLANADDVSCTLSNVTITASTKYARIYLTDASGNMVDPTGMLTLDPAGSTVSGHDEYGYYIYNNGSSITAPTVTLTLTDATLNQYKVVMVTSADNAVTEGGAVVNEPDWDTQTTWSFKYPVSHTEATGTVEWSPVSMTVPLDIDALKGSGYLSTLTDYHVVWTVSVDGTEATPATGTARQDGQWTMDGNTPTFYAPTGQTFANMSNVTFIARLYETATGENDADKSLTYTVSIDRSKFLGQHKSTFDTDDETVELDDADATPVTVPLSHAVFSGAKYARVWLTQDGAPITPTGKLALPTGMTAFGTNHDAVYGYFLYNESGISLSDVTLTLAAGTYPDYQVHVALSVDAPIGYTDFARADAPRRAPSLDAYEPDYDYEYIFSFVSPYERIRLNLIADTQLGDNSVTLNIWDKILNKLEKDNDAAFFATNSNYTKWYIEDANGNRQPLVLNSNAENGKWTTTQNNQSNGTTENDEYYWNSSMGGFSQYYNLLGRLDFKTPSGTTLEDFRGYRFICEVSDEFDGTNAVPKVIFWIPIPDYFVGTLKTGTPVEETVIVEEDTKTYTLTELQTQYETFVTSKSVTNTDQIYLRLYAANVNGTLADDQSVYTFANLPDGFSQIDQGWAYLGQALTAEQITALAAATVTSTQNLYETGRKVGFIMAKAPFDERFYPTDAATVEAIINEPKWDYQYLLRFDQFLTTDGPTMIEETVTVRPGTADAEGRYTFSIADIAALSAGAKGFDAKYMRWYLADSNGNIINPQTFTQYTWGPGGWTNNTRWFITDVNTTPPTPGITHDHNEINRASDNALKYGQMWWYTNDNTVEFDDLSFKVTTPMVGGGWGGYYHDDLQNYQVVVYLSDNDDASLLTQTTGEGPAATTTVTKEPTPDYKITIKFNSFFGDLDADATEIEQTFRQPLEEWNEECANGAREYVISFDYANKKVIMQKANGTGDAMEKTMSDTEYAFWSTFTDGTGTVPYEQNFYFRWFLRNKATGETAEIVNSIVSAPGGSALQDVIQYNATNWGGTTYYNNLGNRAPGSKYFCNYFSGTGKDLATLLRVKIDGSPTGSDCFSLTDYDLVLLLNSTEKGEGEQATPWGETQHYCLVREPATFDLQYTFHFTTDFEADNIDDPTLKTKYKTLIYDPVTRSATPTILSNYYEISGDLQTTRDSLATKGYVRWYLVSKATGEPIPMANLTNTGDEKYTSLGNQYGYYRYKFKKDDLRAEGAYFHGFDPTITLPEGVRYQDVRIVAVFTTLTEPQDEPNQNLPKDLPAREPRQMQVKYVYDLVLEETLRDHWPFTHYHGIHYPLYHRSFEDSREFIGPGQPQDLPDEGTAYVNQRVWDYGKNAIYDPADNSYEAGRTYNHGGHNPDPASPDYTTRNIRQKVHTKEYNYYLLLADGEKETLKLPFQYFDGEPHSTVWSDNVRGSDAEPIGYIRWYDWKTDLNSEYITPTTKTSTGATGQNTELKQLFSHVGTNTFDRGWYTIMSSLNPTQDKVGVDFVAPEGFSEMTDEIVIACDVSRYMDGLDDSKQYLVHEPTLSIRYIYHILPAKVLAKRMTDATADFTRVMGILQDTPGDDPIQFSDIDNYLRTFHLLEYNGRTVVSVKGSGDATKPAQGNFSLRTSLTELDHYYVEVDGELKPCNNLQWYAYYEYEGKLYRHEVPMVKQAGDWTVEGSAVKYNPGGAYYHREQVRLAVFETKDFWGSYKRVRNEEEVMDFKIQPGQFIHLVGSLGYKEDGVVKAQVPTVSTELFFVDAEPKPLGSEGIERTDYTMSSQYKKAAELNFDDFFDDPATRYDKPTTSFENYAKIPMLFADAQYGFCYPRLYGQCANDYFLHHYGGWPGYGFAPLHGDYTILKSMGMEGVSKTRDDAGNAGYVDRLDEQSMYPLWYVYAPKSLYDITHERANQKNITDTQDYGAFLYVDAAEQSRTIGRLELDAQLCAGAEIYFTAYIADMTEAYDTHATPQVRFRVYTYNTKSGYPMGTVAGDEYLDGYTSSATVPVISFVTGDIATEGASEKGQWYQVYGYCNLPAENRAFLEGDTRHFYVEVDNYCENTNGADYAVDQITFYTNSARVRIAQASDVCDDEKGVKLRITALASALLPHFGQGQDREIFYRIYPYSDDPNKTELEADEAITGQNVYCHEHLNDDGDRGNLYGAVPFHVGYNDQATYESNYDQTLYDSLEALLEAKKDLPEYQPKYGFYKDGDEVYYLLDERYFELTAGQEYFVSIYTLGSYKPGSLEGWGNPYGNHTCTAYSNNIMPRNMFIELTEDSETSDGIIDFSCSRVSAEKDFGVRVRYPLESGGYETYTGLPFDFFLGTKSDFDACYLTHTVDGEEVPVLWTYTDTEGHEQQSRIRLSDALAHFRSLKDGDSYKYRGAYTTVPTEYQSEDEPNRYYYQILKLYVEDKKLLRLEAESTFHNTFTVGDPLNEPLDIAYLAIPLYPQIDEDKEICSPITMQFHLDPTGAAPLLELGFDDVKYPADYTKRGVRLGLEQLANMRDKDKGYRLHIPISNYQEKNHEKRLAEADDPTTYKPNALYFDSPLLRLSGTNDPSYLGDDGKLTSEAAQLIVTTIEAPGADGSSNDGDDGTGVYVNNNRMYLPLSFVHDASLTDDNYVTFKEGYWYEVSTRYYDAGDVTEFHNAADYCYADLFIVFKVVPEFATWDAQPIGTTHLYNVSWHNDQNWKRSMRSDLYKDANDEDRKQNTNTAGHPAGYDNDGEGSLSVLTGDLYDANPNPGFVPMKFTYVTLLTGNHAPSLINEAHTTTGSPQTGGHLIDPNRTELMTDTSPVDNKESSRATSNIRYDMVVRYGPHDHGGEGCFGHRSKTQGTDGTWSWQNDKRTDMTSYNESHKAYDVEKFYGNICKEIYFKPEAELLRQQRLTYEKAWVEKELVANTWYLAASPLKSTYAGDMYVPTSMLDLSMAEPATKPGRQMTEAFQPISFNQTANTVTGGTATSTPAYSRTKYPIYQRSWRTDGSKVYTKENDMRANDYSANLDYQSVSETFLEWSHTYNDVQVPYSSATTLDKVAVPMGFSIRANRKVQKDGSSNDVPALIRLPKADETYQYYDWSDAGSTPAGGTQTVSKPQAQLTNSINGATWIYTEPMQHRFITDDASKESSTQGAMEFEFDDLQVQGDYVLVGNPVVSSLNMGEFFNGNPNLTFVGEAPTGTNVTRYSYWTYEGGQAKAFLVDKTATTHTVTVDGNTTEVQDINYTITSDGNSEVGTIRPMQAFFVKKGSADKIYFTRNMGIDGNFPVNNATSGTGSGGTGTDGGARPFGVTLTAATTLGGSSATVWQRDDSSNGYNEGEDVETLFHSNLSDVPMVYTVAGGQAVSIDQRPQLDIVPFGIVQVNNEPVEVTVTSHPSPLTSHLFFIDALTGEETPVDDGTTITVQPNDYGRYFLSATTGVQSKNDTERALVISVRQQEVTVTAIGSRLSQVAATTLDGKTVFNTTKGLDTQCRFQLAKGVYIISARTKDGQQRQMKVVVK